MFTFKRKAIGIALGGFLLTFALGTGIAMLKAGNGQTTGTILDARLDENSSSQPFIADAGNFQTGESLDFIQFVNSSVGWAGNSKGVVHRTTDGAKSWQRLDFKLEGYVTGMHFAAESSGWAISMRYPQNLLKTEYEATLLHTNDGGKAWHAQFAAQSVELIGLNFISSKEGWVLGAKFFKLGDRMKSEMFVLHTVDGGKNWVEKSNELNSAVRASSVEQSEFPADILAIKGDAAAVVTRSGLTFRTSDGGRRWQSLGKYETAGLDAQKLMQASLETDPRVLASTGGGHGTLSLLAVRQSDSWSSRVLDRILLKDALYISDKELLACGSVLLPNNQPLERNGAGIVLYSANEGRNWTVVHRSSKAQSLNALARSDEKNVWIAASDGSFVHLKKEK
jgi:photosystem II stability/assembly factor-like uncharacterized protein